MINHDKYNLFICSLISLLIGAIVFIWFYGYKVIIPTNTDWLYNSNIDMCLYYTGWNIFRNSPWTFPLGIFDGISYPNQTSILNTDSIPLLAIFFKCFRKILPIDFQYLGLSALIGYMLQSFFGMLIVKKYTKNNIVGYVIALLSSIFFILMPNFVVWTLRNSVCSFHWIILSCFIPIVYNFTLKNRIIYYSIISFMAAGINPYILVISFLIILIHCIYSFWNKKEFKEIFPILSFILFSFIQLGIIGAFVGLSQIKYEYLNECSANLNSFINSCGFLRFFDNFYIYSFRQIEGYGYFGIGILALILLVFINITIRYLKDEFDFKYNKKVILIVFTTILSIVLALSPTITFSNKVLFEIHYPDFIINIWSIFRSTGRFVWIANYLILTSLLVYIVKHFSTKKLLIVLLCCLCLQIYDFIPSNKNKHGFFCEYRNNLKNNIYKKELYIDKAWNRLFEQNNIKYIFFDRYIYSKLYGENSASSIVVFALRTKNNHIKFNSFYYARPVKGLDEAYNNELDNPKNEDIFIFVSEEHNIKLLTSKKLKYFYRYNGMYIARTIKIKGWEDLEVKKDDIKWQFRT